MNTYTLRIGKTFFDDHLDRDLVDEYEMLKTTKTTYLVRLFESDALELLNDAEYYATECSYMGSDYRALGQSAKATAAAVIKQMTAQGYKFPA